MVANGEVINSTKFGFVRTPDSLVDYMVAQLTSEYEITRETRILVPGCGDGQFIKGLIRYFEDTDLPRITAIELHPERFSQVRDEFGDRIEVLNQNFLTSQYDDFDLIIGNPPYVPIEGIGESDKTQFKSLFYSAYNRFDLYFLFFEKSLSLLKGRGKLVFVTPFKFLFVESATKLRDLISRYHVRQIHIVSENSFPSVTAYPCVSTITNEPSEEPTHVIRQDGETRDISLSPSEGNWICVLEDKVQMEDSKRTLKDVCERISLGPATGSDKLFVVHNDVVLPELLDSLCHPTISGRELVSGTTTFEHSSRMIIPYHLDSNKPMIEIEDELENSFSKLNQDLVELKKEKGTKPWFKFKDSVPFHDLLAPKILLKDITEKPEFWLDSSGITMPRHTVYYLTTKEGTELVKLLDYLRSDIAIKWLESECQKAANGSLRVQTAVLRRLPVPDNL